MSKLIDSCANSTCTIVFFGVLYWQRPQGGLYTIWFRNASKTNWKERGVWFRSHNFPLDLNDCMCTRFWTLKYRRFLYSIDMAAKRSQRVDRSCSNASDHLIHWFCCRLGAFIHLFCWTQAEHVIPKKTYTQLELPQRFAAFAAIPKGRAPSWRRRAKIWCRRCCVKSW